MNSSNCTASTPFEIEMLLFATDILFCIPLIPMIIQCSAPKPPPAVCAFTGMLLLIQAAIFMVLNIKFPAVTVFICAIQWFILLIQSVCSNYSKRELIPMTPIYKPADNEFPLI